MRSTLILLILLTLHTSLLAQDSTEFPIQKYHKNGIYGNVGSLLATWSATIYYERSLLSKKWVSNRQKKDVYFSTFARIGFGGMAIILYDEGKYALGQLGFLIGGLSSHFEACIGAAYHIDNSFFLTEWVPSASVGYRRQKLGSQFIFRTGISMPEMVYFGIGFAF